jgi:hypothetical protein
MKYCDECEEFVQKYKCPTCGLALCEDCTDAVEKSCTYCSPRMEEIKKKIIKKVKKVK